MVTFKTVDNPIDAHLLKSKLEGAGIRCELRYANPCGDGDESSKRLADKIQLHISPLDIEHAHRLVEATMRAIPSASSWDCPNCNATNSISQGIKEEPLMMFIDSLFTLSTLDYSKRQSHVLSRYTCQNCGLNYSPQE